MDKDMESLSQMDKTNQTMLIKQNQALVNKLQNIRIARNAEVQNTQSSQKRIEESSMCLDMLTNALKNFMNKTDFLNKSINSRQKEDIGFFMGMTFQTMEDLISQRGTCNEDIEAFKDNYATKTNELFDCFEALYQALQKSFNDNSSNKKDSSGSDSTKIKTLEQKVKVLESVEQKNIRRIEFLENENLMLKNQNSQTGELQEENNKLKIDKEKQFLRMRILNNFDSIEADELIDMPCLEKMLSYDCVCGGSNMDKLATSISTKIEEIREKLVQQTLSKNNQNDTDGCKKETMADIENALEVKEKVIEDQTRNLESLKQKYEESKIQKKSLDSKFIKSHLVQSLVKQVQSQLKYTNNLFKRLEESYSNLLEIEKMRGFEIKDQQDKENVVKEKLSFELAVVKRDLQTYKERNESSMDLEKLAVIKSNDAELQKHNKIIQDLNQNLCNQTEKLKEQTKNFEDEKKRCHKYLKEISIVKETHYDQLLKKYSDCSNAVMRHTRYQEMFKRLYDFDKQYNQDLKDCQDELKKYVNSRDDKINYLEKKHKRQDKELELEKTRSKDYQQEIQNTAISFGEIQAQFENKSNEIKDCNDNFNKLYKEKHNEKLNYQHEKNTQQAKIKNDAEITHTQNGLLTELRKKIELLDTHIKEMEGTNWTQNKVLEEINQQKAELLNNLENKNTEMLIENNKVVAFDSSIKAMSKEFSLLRKDASEKSKMLEQFIRTTKAGEELDLKDMSNEQILYERMELKRTRRLLTCPVCEKREKQVIVIKCMHTFCNECIKKNLDHRERKCPLCMVKISQADVKKMFLEQFCVF